MTRIKYKEAIGTEVKRGRPSESKKPSKQELEKLYIKEGKSIREVGELLNCSKDMVIRSLREYGIEVRTRQRRSKLKDIKLSDLEKGVREKGISGYARELNVAFSTLHHHLKVRRETEVYRSKD